MRRCGVSIDELKLEGVRFHCNYIIFGRWFAWFVRLRSLILCWWTVFNTCCRNWQGRTLFMSVEGLERLRHIWMPVWVLRTDLYMCCGDRCELTRRVKNWNFFLQTWISEVFIVGLLCTWKHLRMNRSTMTMDHTNTLWNTEFCKNISVDSNFLHVFHWTCVNLVCFSRAVSNYRS